MGSCRVVRFPKIINLECGLGDNDTTNEQPKQKIILKLTKRHESNTYGDIIDKVFSNLTA